jgi:glycosyltransferase involved in cell wall biosynthesis
MKISFFFPCYNDEMTVGPMVEKADSVLSRCADDYEIIIIDDASPDRTGAIADELVRSNPRVRVVHHPVNRGYGQALRSGFEKSKFEWVLFTDGDMQYDLAELDRFLPMVGEADLILGYKEKRADGMFRTICSRLFNSSIHIFVGLKVNDVDCGFKLIRRDIYEKIRVDYPYRESFYLIELMARAKKKGYRIREVPVTHHARPHGRSQLFSFGAAARYLFYTFRGSIQRLTGAWN